MGRSILTILPTLLLSCAAERPPSVLVLSLDTLRADRLGVYGNPDGLTPNLDRLAGESVLFEQAYSQAPETLFSHGSLFTSRYPSELGRLSYSTALPEEVPTLPEVMALYGMRTGAAVGGIHLDSEYGFSRGFESYASPTREAGSLFHTLPPALDWLDSLEDDDPFFLFLHGYDTHSRYLKPPPFGEALTEPGYDRLGARIAQAKGGTDRVFNGHLMSGVTLEAMLDLTQIRHHHDGVWRSLPGWITTRRQKLLESDIEYLRQVYDGAVAYADAWVGRTMAALEQRGLLESTFIIVLSDHGEQLGESGVFAHRYALDDTTLHVPLMMRLPGGEGGGERIAAPVTLLDVAPTFMDFIYATPPAGIHGNSLLPVLHGQSPPVRQTVFAEGMFRMISARSEAGRLTFTGVGADSAFLPELLATSPLDGPAFDGASEGADREDLQASMLAWRSSLGTAHRASEQISATLLKELQQNGYWGDL